MTDFLRTNGIAVIGSTQINLINASYDRGNHQQAYPTGGFASPGTVASFGGSPKITCTSYDIGGVLGVCSLIDNSVTTNNVSVYSQLVKTEGVRASTATKYTVSKGMLAIESISAEQGSPATITFSITPASSDGFVSPVGDTSVSIVVGNPQNPLYTLGTATLNGVSLIGTTGWNISLNNGIVSPTTDGAYYCSNTGLMSHAPQATISSINPNLIESTIGDKPLGLNGTTGLQLTLATCDSNGNVIATVAKTFTIKLGTASVNSVPMAQGQIITTGLTVVARSDFVNPVIGVA